ncbi:hypothetical protein BOTBODRAFT_587299 [Botryobasidium botryosum FD-172 SS1]|uniref:Uncharacterized protein n=1 Tax=Botryobasidium botryosum (strain FD-172 SS1) TaxID=930990 RepID=A0A067M8R7_BOTB1|nr:hypothetical protein BOTBODRAFT_587299 [Botryobasidium botryosum FD-172 SS1]
MGCLGVCGPHSPAPCVQPRSESRAAGHPELSRPIVRVYVASLFDGKLTVGGVPVGGGGVRAKLVALWRWSTIGGEGRGDTGVPQGSPIASPVVDWSLNHPIFSIPSSRGFP